MKMDRKLIGGFSHQVYLDGICMEFIVPSGAHTVDFSNLSDVAVGGLLGLFYRILLIVHGYFLKLLGESQRFNSAIHMDVSKGI